MPYPKYVDAENRIIAYMHALDRKTKVKEIHLNLPAYIELRERNLTSQRIKPAPTGLAKLLARIHQAEEPESVVTINEKQYPYKIIASHNIIFVCETRKLWKKYPVEVSFADFYLSKQDIPRFYREIKN